MSSSSFDAYVDTTPMANSINTVAHSVNATSAAVIAMEAAVIAADNQAAEHICQNVNQGFHRLIQSQISQKKVLAQAAASAKLVELRRFALSLRGIKDQLQADFQRITGRYARLFRSLDDSLAARVSHLDADAFKLAERQMPQMTVRVSNVGAPIFIHHSEVRSLSDALLTSRVKKDTVAMLGGIQSYVQRGNALKTAVSEMVQPGAAAMLSWVYVPALLAEQDDVYMATSRVNHVHVGACFGSKCAGLIKRRIDEVQADFVWSEPTARDLDQVKQACRQRISGQVGDPRVATLMAGLLEKASWKVLKGDA